MAEKTPDTTPDETPEVAAGPAPLPELDPDTRLVRNDLGFIHSVTADHYDAYLTITVGNGRKVLLPGWEDVDVATAVAEQPTLFGALDPSLHLTVKEMQDVEEREKFEARHRAAGIAE